MQAEAQTSQQRGIDAHLQARQELLVTDQQQAEGRLGVAAVAAQEPDFLQRGGAQVLGFVDDDDGPEAFQLLPALADEQSRYRCGASGRSAPTPAKQAQQVGAGHRGVGEDQALVTFVGQALEEVLDQQGFADAIGPVEQTAGAHGRPVARADGAFG